MSGTASTGPKCSPRWWCSGWAVGRSRRCRAPLTRRCWRDSSPRWKPPAEMAGTVHVLGMAVAAFTASGWVMVLAKLRDLARDRGNLVLRALCLALVAVTGALTVQRMAPLLDQLAGRLDFGRAMANCLT